MRCIFVLALLFVASCQSQTEKTIEKTDSPAPEITSKDPIRGYYDLHSGSTEKSEAKGTVSNGSLINGKLVPFSGNNYLYFDTISYLNGRAFVHETLLKTVLNTYVKLEKTTPERTFRIMECSNEHGGKICPHRTHQNGLSIDFMTPLIKNDKPYYDLDTLGGTHYLLEFDRSGKSSRDKDVTIDFECIAHHILMLNAEAKENGLRISKVIFNTDLKDDLFATPSGKKLIAQNIYFAKSLTPAINALHDDHYHIDFEILKH